jgi:hypothetical protein
MKEVILNKLSAYINSIMRAAGFSEREHTASVFVPLETQIIIFARLLMPPMPRKRGTLVL